VKIAAFVLLNIKPSMTVVIDDFALGA